MPTGQGLAAFLKRVRGVEPLATLSIAANPEPASRPRVTRWGVYYGKHYTAWMKAAKQQYPKADRGPPIADGPLLVVVDSIVQRPKTSKRLYPQGDVDNYAKGPLDVITQATGWWTDDDQIVALVSTKRFARPGEEPFTYLEVYPCSSSNA